MIRDCQHGHQRGKCDACALLVAEARVAELEAALIGRTVSCVCGGDAALEAQLVAATDCRGVHELQRHCAAMRKALEDIYASIPSTYNEADPTVRRHAAALTAIPAVLSGAVGRELLEAARELVRESTPGARTLNSFNEGDYEAKARAIARLRAALGEGER